MLSSWCPPVPLSQSIPKYCTSTIPSYLAFHRCASFSVEIGHVPRDVPSKGKYNYSEHLVHISGLFATSYSSWLQDTLGNLCMTNGIILSQVYLIQLASCTIRHLPRMTPILILWMLSLALGAGMCIDSDNNIDGWTCRLHTKNMPRQALRWANDVADNGQYPRSFRRQTSTWWQWYWMHAEGSIHIGDGEVRRR